MNLLDIQTTIGSNIQVNQKVIQEAEGQPNTEKVTIRGNCGIWLPANALIAFRGKKLTFADIETRGPKGENEFRRETRIHERRNGEKVVLSSTELVLLRIPSESQLICQIGDRPLLLFETTE